MISSRRSQVTSTQLTGGQWVGPAVRVQNSGQNGYVGFYYWNFGSPELMLFKRSGGYWTQLGSTYNSGALAAGTQLQLDGGRAARSRCWRTGWRRSSATDTSFTGGAPGILAYGSADAGSWSGGSVRSAAVRPTRWAGRCRGFPGRWCCRITAVTT